MRIEWGYKYQESDDICIAVLKFVLTFSFLIPHSSFLIPHPRHVFFVGDTIISDDVATFKFVCDLGRCKGACCVVGDAGAPVKGSELPVLRRAWEQLKDTLRPEAVAVVESEGLYKNNGQGYELSCTEGAECVFVVYDGAGVATCAIQQAYDAGDFSWPKPISCHLFPVRVTKLANHDMLNMEYIPSICSAACDKGERSGVGLAEFLREPLVRVYGNDWYNDFMEAVRDVRSRTVMKG